MSNAPQWSNPTAPEEGMPQTPEIRSLTYAPVLSFVGSTRRIMRWAEGRPSQTWWATTLKLSVVGLALIMWWSVVLGWYCLVYPMYIVFFWAIIPYRMVRRNHRRQKHQNDVQIATMQALLKAQEKK